jgi:hypothetical protein
MYIVHHYNFGTFREFDTLELAIEFAKRAGFEAAISQGKVYASERVATFSPISGLRYI